MYVPLYDSVSLLIERIFWNVVLSSFLTLAFVDCLESIRPVHSNVGVIDTLGCIAAVQVRFKGFPA